MKTIYALIDPRDQAVRYIGATATPEKRLRMHLSYSSRRIHQLWISALLSLNLKPLFHVLEETEDALWREREKAWVKHYRERGADLLNETAGGDGGGVNTGYEFTEQHRANLSKSLLGHAVAPETIQKIRKTKLTRTYRSRKGEKRPLKSHCPFGHEYTAENVYINPITGVRRCRTCNRRHAEQTRARRRAMP